LLNVYKEYMRVKDWTEEVDTGDEEDDGNADNQKLSNNWTLNSIQEEIMLKATESALTSGRGGGRELGEQRFQG
jgi:hypothetical protein